MAQNSVKHITEHLADEVENLTVRSTPSVRAVRRKYSRMLKGSDSKFILELAKALIEQHSLRWVAYELIRNHEEAFKSLDTAELGSLGQGINTWSRVNTFARILSGPAWLHGLISDEVIQRWARSDDLWWRRAALVSTVALKLRSQGGRGDMSRTLAICRMLVSDHEDMVVKALSWALRALVVHDPAAVRAFLTTHRQELAARVIREANNKLETGLKNP